MDNKITGNTWWLASLGVFRFLRIKAQSPSCLVEHLTVEVTVCLAQDEFLSVEMVSGGLLDGEVLFSLSISTFSPESGDHFLSISGA